MKSSISTAYLYNNSTSKILLYPSTPHSAQVPQKFTQALLRHGEVKVNYPPGSITIKLNNQVWGYQVSQHGVNSRLAALDLIRAMQAVGHTLHCCADLCRLGSQAAGCLILSHGNPIVPVELACISFHAHDTIRLISVPEHEAMLFGSVLQRACRQRNGITKVDGRVQCPDYRITNGSPWLASGVNTVHARLIVLEILTHMVTFGWSRCIPVKVSLSDRDLDTLVFMKPKVQRVAQGQVEMACISLHRDNTLRLIGANSDAGVTASTLRGVIMDSWPSGVKSIGSYDVSDEFILDGRPWRAYKTIDAIQSRRFLCRVLESMHRIGWKLYAALDLSKQIADKSSFFFVREAGLPVETIGCISLTDANKVQLVNLPPKVVDRVVHLTQSRSLGELSEPAIRYDAGTASFKLKSRPWDYSRKSIEIMAVSSLITLILQTAFDGGGRLVCSADVSANTITTGTDDNRKTHSADLDSFFFAFPEEQGYK